MDEMIMIEHGEGRVKEEGDRQIVNRET